MVGKVKLLNGDCVEMIRDCVESDSVDMVVTSPPYDAIRKYNGFAFDIDGVIDQLYRVLKPGGVVVWVVGDQVKKGSESGTSFKTALKFIDKGFLLHDTMIYEKNTSSFPAKRNGTRYTQIFEYMFVFSKGKPKTANLICDKPNRWAGHTNWGKNTQRSTDNVLKETSKIKPVPDFSPRTNIWRYVVGGGFATKDKVAHEHPAIFPEQLAEDHILTWSNPGDVVMDPFAGSGTTGKMAMKNGRESILVEISDEYCDIINRRLGLGFDFDDEKEELE